MARRPPSSLPPEALAAIAAMDTDQLRATTAQVLDLASARARRLTAPQRQSRRRPRAAQPFSVTVRVDLHGAKPPVWRRVRLPSTLRLDQLHDLLQLLFGWQDSHLHRFTQGASVWDRDVELFLCPYDVEEREDEGVPTADVRLDEVLAEKGDRLRYVYDYGDEWTVVLVVEAVGEPVERARCTGGRGSAPPEDSGGIWAWNEAADDGGPFDAADLDDDLADWASSARLPAELAELRRQVAGTHAGTTLGRLLDDAELLTGSATVDEAEATEMVRAWTWLLDRVGDGLRLTAAGWLPPAVVTAAMTELGLDRTWIGKNNREDLTEPVRVLRASAQRLGLLRVSKGRLLRTKAGLSLTEDPVGLWRHVAQRTAGSSREPFARAATSLVLLAVAAGRPRDGELDEVLAAAGWRTRVGGAPSSWAVLRAAERAVDVLEVVGAYGDRSGSRPSRAVVPTAGARALARAALDASGRAGPD